MGLKFEYYNDLVSRGQSLPTPIQHVNYSLMIAFATLMAFIYYLEDKSPWLLGIGIVCFLFMHVLAVRTGLVAMYMGIIAFVVADMMRRRKYKRGIVLVAGCLLAPILAYYLLPSFSNKLNYMFWDLSQMYKGNTANYSDGGRIVSYQLGIDIFKNNVWLGTGIGDFGEVCLNWYETKAGEFNGKLNFPHNQYLFCLASTGIIGLIIYQSALLLPFFKLRLYKDNLTLVLYVIIYASFLVETSLERSFGMSFFLYFVLLWLAYLKAKD